MRDAVPMVLLLATLAAFWGIIKPYRGLRRRHFLAATGALFVGFVVSVPPQTPEARAAAAARRASGDQEKVLQKAEAALEGVANYRRSEFEDTYAKVGSETFKTLSMLEPGAIYAAAESASCDRVTVGAVSLTASSRGKAVWYVDCENEHRFMVPAEEAAAALDRFAAKSLGVTDRAPDCLTTNLAWCSASQAQRQADRAEVATICDMAVERALVGDSDMAWSWDYGFGEGDEVQVVRKFTAQNAFGAELKHRYYCTFDAGKKQITFLAVEGPMGMKKLI